MDAQTFLAEFGHIVNAPGGVARLREMVLHLAATGKLIQGTGISDAASMLQSIEQQKRTHPERKKVVPKQAPIPRSRQNIPSHWASCRLGDLALTITGGGTPAKNNPAYWGGNIPWASVKDLKESKYIDDTEDHITQEGLVNSSSNLIEKGRVIVCTRMGLGKIAINRVPIAINQDLKALELPVEVNHDFFTIIYKTRKIKGTGTTVSGIRQEQLLALPAGLPPKEEQVLIVAKVDELMTLCDRLEEQHKEHRCMQSGLRTAVVGTLSQSRESDDLRISWQRISENYGHLVAAPEDVEHLNAEIKNMAVQGLLIPPSTERTDLEAIKRSCLTLRARYQRQGLMRKQKLVSMADHDASYPSHWPVVAFDEVAVVIGGVTKGRDLKNKDVITCPYLSVANVQRGYFTLDQLKTIQIQAGELNKYKVDMSDILITEGGDWDKVGRTAIWQGAIDNCLHQNHVFKARIPSDLLINEWVELVFNSSIGRRYFAGASKQTTNLASINMTQLRSFPLPIPPVQEQRAILRQVSLLTARCLDWQRQLRRKQHLGEAFAQASIASLTGISVIDEDDVVKAPRTELIAPLRLGATPDVKELAPLATILARHQGEMSAKDLWQRFGGDIDVFYAQLKIEVANGWIREPAIAEMREVPQAQASA